MITNNNTKIDMKKVKRMTTFNLGHRVNLLWYYYTFKKRGRVSTEPMHSLLAKGSLENTFQHIQEYQHPLNIILEYEGALYNVEVE